MAIAVAISFDSGILLCADTKDGVPPRIFQRQYGSDPGCARSIFAISEPGDGTVAALQHCERALDILQPGECTIDRMRATIERALPEAYPRHLDSQLESKPEAALLVALYSPADRQCSLFRTNGTALGEFVGYDCQGTAAYLGHYLIRDRYRAAQSMDSLDLSTVFSIAIETLEGVRECLDGCGESTEVVVMYANGCASELQLLRQDIQQQRRSFIFNGRDRDLA
jgi:hypothetical protein